MVMKKRKAPDAVRETFAVPDYLVSHSQPIAAAKFKARCLELMDDVRERGGEYVITKRGVPVARLVPVRAVKRRKLLGSMKGTVRTLGDIVSPLDEPWEALEGWPDEK
jgi:prevent-host-death family protein